jgi:hypothetical protein
MDEKTEAQAAGIIADLLTSALLKKPDYVGPRAEFGWERNAAEWLSAWFARKGPGEINMWAENYVRDRPPLAS